MKHLEAERALAIAKLREQANNLGLKGSFSVVPTTHYLTAKIDSDRVLYTNSENAKKVGLQSFSQDKLPAGKPFVLVGITGLFAEETTGESTKATADYSDEAPAILVNGDLEISQQDRGILVSTLFNQVINQNTTNNNLDREFQTADMPVIKDATEFEVVGTMPAVLPAGKDYFSRLELRGYTIK